MYKNKNIFYQLLTLIVDLTPHKTYPINIIQSKEKLTIH